MTAQPEEITVLFCPRLYIHYRLDGAFDYVELDWDECYENAGTPYYDRVGSEIMSEVSSHACELLDSLIDDGTLPSGIVWPQLHTEVNEAVTD